MIAANVEYLSIHCDMSVIGSQGGPDRLDNCSGTSSRVISDISTYSKFNIHFTTLAGSEAVGGDSRFERVGLDLLYPGEAERSVGWLQQQEGLAHWCLRQLRD